ncbi:MAG: hypothetical protein J6T01_01080 [Kiritimatiellae bacterium]|nr:hypothetical protein [Kiritimatiellia bacterium]
MATATSFAGVSRETPAIQSQIDAAAAAGGGRVTVTEGVHPCGTLHLKSGVELHLEEGAVLLGGARSEDYADVENSDGIRPEANPPFSRKAFIVAADAHDIAITGKGVIDGQGTLFFDQSSVLWGQWWQKPPHPRPRMIQFARCRNVRLEGVTFKDSPMWTMWMRRCENLTVSGIRVVAHPKIINSDGIDVDGCRHVRIGDSFFSTGDDCIVLRAIADRIDPANPVVCEDVVVSNCTLRSVCQGVRIGCPSDDLIRNAVFRDMVFEGRNAVVSQQPLCYLRTDLLPRCRGLLKTQNILFENWKATCTGRPVEIAVQEGIVLPGFGHMTFRNFDVKADKPVLVHGNAASHVNDIRFENVKGKISADRAFDLANASCETNALSNAILLL